VLVAFSLSTSAQAPHKIVRFLIEEAPAAYIVEAVVVEQIQFAQRGIAPRFIVKPADELTKAEAIIDDR